MIKENSNLIEMFKWNKIDILVHGANTLGGVMGAGIALSIKNEYPEVLETDINFSIPKGRKRLGNISICKIINKATNNYQYIVNAYTQASLRSINNKKPFEINALKECLEKIYLKTEDYFPEIKDKKIIKIGFPYIGAGLGGGDKEEIEKLIEEYSKKNNKIKTFLIDFNNDLNEDNNINRFRQENGFLSNFQWLENPIEYNGRKYYSVESAYMSAKADYLLEKEQNNDLFNNNIKDEWQTYCENINNEKQGEMKKRSYNLPINNELWNKEKLKLMHNFVYQKFKNNKQLSHKLLNTGDKLIIEGNYWNDIYWGFCLKTNKGQNLLGRIIMDVRKQIRLENEMEMKPQYHSKKQFNLKK